MKTHADIDRRSLALAHAIVAIIDADPDSGLAQAREVSRRWDRRQKTAVHREWSAILQRPWSEVRAILLAESEKGQRLRQSAPFCGILTPRQRWAIYKTWSAGEA